MRARCRKQLFLGAFGRYMSLEPLEIGQKLSYKLTTVVFAVALLSVRIPLVWIVEGVL